MNYKPIILAVLFIIVPLKLSYCEGVDSIPDNYNSDFFLGRNPFQPQMPLPAAAKTKISERRKSREIPIKKKKAKIEDNVIIKDTPGDLGFIPAKPKGTMKPKLSITGLIWNSPRPQAIINGKIVNNGDKMKEEKIEIVSIQKGGIHIYYDGQAMTINP